MRSTITTPLIPSRILTLIKLCLLAGLIYCINQIYTHSLTIQTIDCNYQSSSCPQPVIAELNRLIGSHIHTLDTNQLRKKILGGNPQLADIIIVKSLPARVSITLIPAQITAQISPDINSGSFSITNTFYIANIHRQILSGVPLILVPDTSDIQVGQPINPPLTPLVKLSQLLSAQNIDFLYINAASQSAQVALTNENMALFNPEADLVEQVNRLKLIYSQSPPHYRTIDLRFNKPILVP